MKIKEAVRRFKKKHPFKEIEGYWEKDNGFILSVNRSFHRINKHFFVDDNCIRIATDEENNEVKTIPLTVYDDVEAQFGSDIVEGVISLLFLAGLILVLKLWKNYSVWQLLYHLKFIGTWFFLNNVMDMIVHARAIKGKAIPGFYKHIRKHDALYLIIVCLLELLFDPFLVFVVLK